MTTYKRALTIKIDAESDSDLVMLLRQALYELGESLPSLPGGTGDLPKRSSASWASRQRGDLSIRGSTSGSLGSYEFELLKCSRDYYSLECELFALGYTKKINDFLELDGAVYVHSALPAKAITGDPPAIVDAKIDDAGF